jgi:hypothetical protein
MFLNASVGRTIPQRSLSYGELLREQLAAAQDLLVETAVDAGTWVFHASRNAQDGGFWVSVVFVVSLSRRDKTKVHRAMGGSNG